jgi:hypothetical protein
MILRMKFKDLAIAFALGVVAGFVGSRLLPPQNSRYVLSATSVAVVKLDCQTGEAWCCIPNGSPWKKITNSN